METGNISINFSLCLVCQSQKEEELVKFAIVEIGDKCPTLQRYIGHLRRTCQGHAMNATEINENC